MTCWALCVGFLLLNMRWLDLSGLISMTILYTYLLQYVSPIIEDTQIPDRSVSKCPPVSFSSMIPRENDHRTPF